MVEKIKEQIKKDMSELDKYLFTRLITKREAINQYGKLGFTTHREGVIIEAESYKDAMEQIKPYNYKKHIKYTICRDPRFDTKQFMNAWQVNTIIDFGKVD